MLNEPIVVYKQDDHTELTIWGHGRDTTVVDANGTSDDVLDLVLSSVSIEDISIVGSTSYAIWTYSVDLRLARVRVSDNARAGLLCDYHCYAELVDVEVVRNAVGAYVGSASSIVVADSIIAENTGRGLTVNSDGATITVLRSEIRNNSGGGISGSFSSRIHLEESTVADNVAIDGGGVSVGSVAALSATNSTISGNRATRNGGGIFRFETYHQHSELVQTTVTQNTADSDGDGIGDGGGLFDEQVCCEELRVVNSLIAGNHDLSGQAPDCAGAGALISGGHNLIGDSTGCELAGDTSTDLLDVDPLLSPLTWNGGATPTHRLQPGSPAIDAIPGAACTSPAGDPVDFDQRGVPRPHGPACDIGAVEVAYTLACDDDVDNDGDGKIDTAADPGCGSPISDLEDPQCDDGLDNDGDGLCDTAASTCLDGSTPGDSACTAGSIDDERAACDDGVDNDGDALADFPSDPGCLSPSDNSEHEDALACDDGRDNDGDALADYPADPGCGAPGWFREDPQCDDRIDNDGDGYCDTATATCVDGSTPGDPHCASASLYREVPICSDGKDNDGDGLVDLADPQCASAIDQSETCGLGWELVLVLPTVVLVRRIAVRRNPQR